MDRNEALREEAQRLRKENKEGGKPRGGLTRIIVVEADPLTNGLEATLTLRKRYRGRSQRRGGLSLCYATPARVSD